MSSPPIYLVTQGSSSVITNRIEPPPIGVLYIGAALQKAGYRVKIFHLRGEDRMKPIKDAVNRERPLFVGFSNFVSSLLRFDVELSRWLKNRGIKVVWGGVFATTLPRVTLESGCVDYVAVGEGEKLVVELARAIREGAETPAIPGAGHRKNGEIVINPPDPPGPDLDRFDFGKELIDWEDYIHVLPGGERLARIPFSRGCPFRCSFCYNCADPARQKWRGHSPDYMKDMISFFKKEYKADLFFFVCDNPFGKTEQGKKVIESLEEPWASTCHLKTISPEFIDWAVEARCRRLGLGLESGSDRILDAMNKGITADDIRERMQWCEDKGLNIMSNWMAMVPGESTEDIRKTLGLMEEIHASTTRHTMGFAIFRAYPGTRFWEDSLKLGHYEPKNLDEWADYKAEINTLLGFSDQQAKRMHMLAANLFRKSRNQYPPWFAPVRSLLTRRLCNASFNGPLEESVMAGVKGYRKIKGTLKRA